MEKLMVDGEGKITIPARILSRRGLRPGDELLLVEAAEGLLLYPRGANALTARWWDSLIEEERRRARAEAPGYVNLSEQKGDGICGEGTNSAEEVAIGDKEAVPNKVA